METQSWATLITDPLGAIQRLHSEGHAVADDGVKEYFSQCVENMPLEKVWCACFAFCIVSSTLKTLMMFLINFELRTRRQGWMAKGRASWLIS